MTTKKRTVLISLATVFFAAIWCGAYCLHILGDKDWRSVPTTVTMVTLGLLSFMGVMYASVEME
jgi:hypothetical protein